MDLKILLFNSNNLLAQLSEEVCIKLSILQWLYIFPRIVNAVFWDYGNPRRSI